MEKRDLIAKRSNYDKFIKMVHKPVVDKAKVSELQERIVTLKHPVKDKVIYTPGMTQEQVEYLNNKDKPESEPFFVKRRSLSSYKKDKMTNSIGHLPRLKSSSTLKQAGS